MVSFVAVYLVTWKSNLKVTFIECEYIISTFIIMQVPTESCESNAHCSITDRSHYNWWSIAT